MRDKSNLTRLLSRSQTKVAVDGLSRPARKVSAMMRNMHDRLVIRTVTFDCTDARTLATFWAGALGWNVYLDDDPEVVVAPSFPPPTGPRPPVLLFIPVPEGKAAKNRVHLDLGSDGGSRDEQVARLVALGATQVADHRTAEGLGWIVLADPEGNEFCIERSEAERAAQTAPRSYRVGPA
jgi:hypothetical protein